MQVARQDAAKCTFWAEKTLVWHVYDSLRQAEKGLVRRLKAEMTGLSQVQSTWLITCHRKTGQEVEPSVYQRT